MVYNLDDIKLWEPVLYGVTSTMQQISTVKKDEESDDEKVNTLLIIHPH